MVIFSEISATVSKEVADLLPGDTASIKKQSFTHVLGSMGKDLSTVQVKCHKKNVQVVGDWDSVCKIHEALQSWMTLQIDIKLEVDHLEGEMDRNKNECQAIIPSLRLASDVNTVLNKGADDLEDGDTFEGEDLDETISNQDEQPTKQEIQETFQISPEASKNHKNNTCEPDIEDDAKNSGNDDEETIDLDINHENEQTETDSDLASDQTSEGDTTDTDGEPRRNSVLRQSTKCRNCNYCGENFTTNANCKNHQMKKHLSHYVARLQLRAPIKPPSNKQNCPECYMLVDNFELLVQHFEAVHVKKNHPDAITKGKTFQCSVCECSYNKRNLLRDHCKRVHWPKQFECSYCGKSFGTKRYLNGHIKKIHEDVKLACNICGVLRKGKWSLKKHIERIHEGKPKQKLVPNHLCGICGKACWSNAQLRDHINKHKDIKAHKCVTCDKEFYSKSSLTLHIKQTHKTTKVQFVCETCGKIFISRLSVSNHVKLVHSSKNEQCGQCGKQFVNGSTLARHMRTHTGSRPYPCQLCGKAFNDYSILRRHLLGVHKTDDRSLCKKGTGTMN